MSYLFRSVLLILMSTGLFFGFLPLFIPEGFPYDFDRLHVFLFNLVSGGIIILYHTETNRTPSLKVMIFGILAFVYALFAFLKMYLPCIFLSVILSGIVESVRIRKFSIFPHNFFSAKASVSDKFHQASLLCLSIGLLTSGGVILNNEYLKLISMKKLQLDTFFLGFSFPLSLITMSVMFSIMREDFSELTEKLKNIGFWNVNLGVIIFFLFILFERFAAQIVVTTILFLTVIMILYLFIKLGVNIQQKNFLVSGMGFLLITAISGIIYILMELAPTWYDPAASKALLKLHTIASLYGWNLSGLAVICRYKDFPIFLHSTPLIIFHWITVILIAPLGYYYQPFAALAVICYTIFLYIVFSSEGNRKYIKANIR